MMCYVVLLSFVVRVLGRFLVVLGVSWVDFWSFGRSFGGSWGGLGGSWAPLGRLLGGLVPSWVVRVVLGSFLEPAPPYGHPLLGGPRGAKMEPKSDPRGTKIDVKNEVEKERS